MNREKIITLILQDHEQLLSDYDVDPEIAMNDPEHGEAVSALADAVCAAFEPIAAPDVAQAARVIENNGAEATAVAMLFHIEISLRTHGKATLTTGDDFGQQVLEFCAALRALLPEGGA